jgi:hypothetical protein
MPVIRISDATWKRMKRHAVPLEDTPDDVVKRALDALDEAAGRVRSQPQPQAQSQLEAPSESAEGAAAPVAAIDEGSSDASKLPQKVFRLPLVETLCALGGFGSTKQIRDLMLAKMAPLLTAPDYAAVSSGDPRWWNAVCWERNNLVNEGLVRKDSPRGSWELTDQGLQTIGGLYPFVFTRDYPTSIESQVFQFMKGQEVPSQYFPRAVREKWPMEAAKPAT